MEGWAQIITHWVVQDIGGSLQRTFEQLNRGQSRPYHVYKNYALCPRVMSSEPCPI